MQKHSFVSAALITAALIALAGCGNALHDLHEKDGVQHPAVTFNSATGTLAQRAHFQFAAKTSGVYGNRAEDVTWELEVVSGRAPGAALSADGLLSLRFKDEPGAVLAVTARSVRRPELSVTELVTVEHFFILEGADDDEDVKVFFTNGGPMTGHTANGGVAFDDDDLPAGDWVMEKVVIGTLPGTTTEVLVGRPSGSVGEHGVHLKLNGGGGSYTLEHRTADGDGFIPIGSYAEFQLIYDLANLPNLGKKYKQEAELDLLGDKDGNGTIGAGGLGDTYEEWMRIGNNANRFTGTFDGDNKGLRNIYINESSNYQGLFGATGVGSTISNIHIRSGTVTGGGSNVGGVVGSSLGTLTNCSNGSRVTGGGSYVGGVVGINNTRSASK
jgi:hypothetical protein